MTGTGRVWVRNRDTLTTRTVPRAEVLLLGDAWEQITAAEAAAQLSQRRESR